MCGGSLMWYSIPKMFFKVSIFVLSAHKSLKMKMSEKIHSKTIMNFCVWILIFFLKKKQKKNYMFKFCVFIWVPGSVWEHVVYDVSLSFISLPQSTSPFLKNCPQEGGICGCCGFLRSKIWRISWGFKSKYFYQNVSAASRQIYSDIHAIAAPL